MKTVLSFLAMSLLLSTIVDAHTHLVRSSPAESARLAAAPSSATLVFAEPVSLTAVKIEPGDGASIALKPPGAAPSASFIVALPPLGAGSYTLRWRASSDDGHIMSGAIHFTILEPGAR